MAEPASHPLILLWYGQVLFVRRKDADQALQNSPDLVIIEELVELPDRNKEFYYHPGLVVDTPPGLPGAILRDLLPQLVLLSEPEVAVAPVFNRVDALDVRRLRG